MLDFRRRVDHGFEAREPASPFLTGSMCHLLPLESRSVLEARAGSCHSTPAWVPQDTALPSISSQPWDQAARARQAQDRRLEAAACHGRSLDELPGRQGANQQAHHIGRFPRST
ncbi:hypothetical protein V2G26_014066 [Clonostachys chloroleuca]